MPPRYSLTYITSAQLGTGTWRGSTHSFILHWQDQVRKYENQIDSKDCFPAEVKRTMLENAVKSVPELRMVKERADQHKVHGKKLTYEQYASLLCSAAQSYDSTFLTRPNSKGARRAV